jgi:D-3-phosphoglycerate dehydrogenase / 2-oxoglutarate reductase
MDRPHKILVTPRSLTRAPHPGLDLLRSEGYEVVIVRPGEQPTEQELLDVLPDCVGYLAGVEPVSARVLSAAGHLVAISRNGVGIDNIDADAARQAGIQILITPGANSEGVAELAIGLMFALLRALPASDRIIKGGGWTRELGFELKGRTLGVVGCGNIGRRVTELALGIGMVVFGYDPYPYEGFSPAGFTWADMDTLLSEAHIVTLHSPASGKPIIDTDAVNRMRDGAYLVNTARAGLVDADAVVSALERGQLSGYAVDAYDTEPPADLGLAGHPRVIATPHIGGYTQESVQRSAMGAARNLLDALREKKNG